MNLLKTVPVENKRFDIQPWGATPNARSRITGLGGSGHLADPACVFETAPLTFEKGPVTLTVAIEGFVGEPASMLLSLTNGPTLPGCPAVRMRLEIAELHPSPDEILSFQISFIEHNNIAYQLSSYIHTDENVSARHLFISSDRPVSTGLREFPQARSSLVRSPRHSQFPDSTASRFFDDTRPNFDQLFSQPATPEQFKHPDFRRLQGELVWPQATADHRVWGEVFALRAMELFDLLNPSRAIGFDIKNSPLWQWLVTKGSEVTVVDRTFDPEKCVNLGEQRAALLKGLTNSGEIDRRFHWTLIGDALPRNFCGAFDFAWWEIHKPQHWRDICLGILNVAESLDENGLGIAIFPLNFTTSQPNIQGSAEIDLPRILIELVSRGHNVVQVRLPSAEIVGLTNFAIIIRR